MAVVNIYGGKTGLSQTYMIELKTFACEFLKQKYYAWG